GQAPPVDPVHGNQNPGAIALMFGIGNVLFLQKPTVAAENLFPVQHGPDAPACQLLQLLGTPQGDALAHCLRDNAFGNGVGGVLLTAGAEFQNFSAAVDALNAEVAPSQSTGFVHDHGLDF